MHLVTRHGRSTPLVWMTVATRDLKGRRNDYEDTVLTRFHEVRPAGVTVTVLADRGFGDQHLSALLTDLDFRFVIPFRGNITVQAATGETRTAAAWVPATVTAERYALDAVVCVQARRMQQPWCLAVRADRRPAGGAPVRPPVHHRRGLPGYQGCAVWARAVGHAHPRPVSPRSPPAHWGDGHGAADLSRRRRREPRHGSHAQGQDGHDRLVPPIQRFGEYLLREPVSMSSASVSNEEMSQHLLL